MNQLREEVALADALKKKKELEEGPKAAFGYGGKFGVEADRYYELCVNISSCVCRRLSLFNRSVIN